MNIRNTIDLLQQAAEPITEGDQGDQRIGDIAQYAGRGELFPDQEIAPLDRHETHGKLRQRVSDTLHLNPS